MVLGILIFCGCLACCLAYCCVMCINNQEQTEKAPEEAHMYSLTSDQKTAEIDCLDEQPMQPQYSIQQVGEQPNQPNLNADFPYSLPTNLLVGPINNTQVPYDAQKDYTQIQPTAPQMETPLLTGRNSEYENIVHNPNRNVFK